MGVALAWMTSPLPPCPMPLSVSDLIPQMLQTKLTLTKHSDRSVPCTVPAFGTFWAYLPSPRYELTPRRSRYLPTGTGHRPSRRPSYLPTLPSWNLSLLLKVAAETVKLLAPFATNHDRRARVRSLFCDPCARPSPGFLAPTPCAHGTNAAAGPLRGHDR